MKLLTTLRQRGSQYLGLGLIGAALIMAVGTVQADRYVIDTKGAHAFIQFRIQHLGYSWLYGRFNEFDGYFTYDPENPAASRVEVTIQTASIDSNHAERDKHLRDGRFLHVAEYPEAKFVSTAYKENPDGTAVLEGDFSLHGVTRRISMDVVQIGAGSDPWGGYRRGFEGKTRIALADYDVVFALGPKSKEVELTLSVEGIRDQQDNF